MAAGGRHFTRVAVAQIAVHPAAFYNQRDPLEDPLWDPKSTRDTLRLTDAALPALVERMTALRGRVRATMCRQVWRKLEAIVTHCHAWKVRVLVLPEYSVPWDVLADLAKVVDDMVVVAGTHTVTRASRKSRVYERLGMPTPREGEAVCPVLHRGKLLALQPKLNPARPEQSQIREGTRWDPVVMPDGFPGPMGVLVCLDFLFRESPRFRELVSERLGECRFLAVPSLTPFHTLPEFEGKAWEEARRYRRPVLYCDTADGGGTALYVDEDRVHDLRRFPEQTGYLERGDEGVIVADVDLGYRHTGSSTMYDSERPVIPFAEASLVYACHPAEKQYAAWLTEQATRTAESLDDDDDALDAARDAVDAARVTIIDAASLRGRESRKRRLSTFLRDAANVPRMEFLRRYTREVVLPPDVLPLAALRAAMAGAAAKTIDAWAMKWRGVGLDEMVKALGEVGREVAVLAPGEWTDEGRSAVGAIEAVISEPVEEQAAPPPPPPVVRTQVPATFDPSTFEDFEADGWTFVFRPDAASIWRENENEAWKEAVEELTTDDRTEVPAGRRRKVFLRADRRRPQVVDRAELVRLFTLAQGTTRVALLSAQNPTIDAGASLSVFAACGDCWRLRTLSDGVFATHASKITSRLEARGFFPLYVDQLSELEIRTSITALRPLVDSARAEIDTFLERKLRDFPQSFIDPEVSVDGGAPTGMLGALDDWLASDVRTALVLGSFGAGKSTTLAQWCHDLWQRDGVRPVFVNLATAGPDRDAIGMLLDAAKADDTPSTRAAMRLLVERRHVLPCFDGFDELSTRTTDQELPERLRRLLAVAGSGGRVLVSSREHYFATESHVTETSRKALVDALGASASWRRICVLELTPDKVRELIDKVHGPERGRAIVRRIETTYDLGDLVRRPLLLSMVLSTIERIDPARKVATADVYEEYLKRWLEQTRAIDGEVFTDAQKQAFAEQLAVILWREGVSSCPWERLDREVSAHLGSVVPVGMPHGAEWLEMRGGAFFVREGDDRYRFAHRSFLEYFFARALVTELEKHPGEALATRPLTREVIAFVGEILVSRREVAAAPCVRAVQAWLVGGRSRSGDLDELRKTAGAAANALRLLTGLAQNAGSEAQWVPAKSDLRAIELAGSELEGVRLAGVSLDHAVLSGSDLRRADLSGAVLHDARMVAGRLDGATLEGADLRGADLSRVEAVGVKLTAADLHDARLRGSVWRGCEWDGAQLARADLLAAVGVRAARELPARLEALIAEGHRGGVQSVAWSPQGDRVVSGGDDGTVRLWDVATAQPLATFEGHTANRHGQKGVRAVAWSPQGDRVVSGGQDGTVRLWDVANAQPLATFSGHKDTVLAVAWSPQGDRVVSGGSGGTVRLWDVATAQQLSTFEGHTANQFGNTAVLAVAWSPQGDRILSGGADSTMRLWEVATAQQLSTFEGHENTVLAVAWSPQGDRVVSGGDDGTVRLWDVATAQPLATFEGHENIVYSVAWSPQGDRVVSGGHDGTVRLWDVATSTQIPNTGNVPLPTPTSFAWSPTDDRVAVAGRDGTLHVFAMRRPHLLATFHISGDHTFMSTPGGYVSAGDAGHDRYVLAVHNPKSPGCAIYLPFAPLREFFHRPDKVAAALRGDLSADDPMADLLAAGFTLDHPWDGNAVYFPDDAIPPPTTPSPASTLENPFLPGRAIETADDLFGRARVFADLCAFVQSRQPVVLEGPRRSGKTSILTVFEAHLRREGREAVVVSLEGEELATKHDLARLLCPDLADHKDPATQFVRTFSKRREVVFLIDEVVHLTKLAPRDLAWVRKVCQKTASFVFAGSPWDWQRVLTHGAREPGSSLGNDVRRLSLGEVPSRDAVEALTRKAPPDAPISEATAAWIVDACGAWPYYLQILGWELVQRSRAGDRSAHNERDAMKRLIESELPRQAEAAFRSRWNELPERARRVLVTERDARRIARHDLDLLVLTGLLRDESGWLHDPPFFDWILRYKTSLPLTPEPSP